jgi:hypothetical protein
MLHCCDGSAVAAWRTLHTSRIDDCVARCCAADAAKSLAQSGTRGDAESRAKRERCEVSLAASLLAVDEALTAISCPKANADVRLPFSRYVAVTTSASWP